MDSIRTRVFEMIKKSDDVFSPWMIQGSIIQIFEYPRFLIHMSSLRGHYLDGDMALKSGFVSKAKLKWLECSSLGIVPQPYSPITPPAKFMDDLVPSIFESVTQVDWMIPALPVAFYGLCIYFT